MDWNGLSAIAALVAALAAIVAVWFQARYTRFSVRMDISWQLERDYYYDEAMIARRRTAAKALLEGRTVIEIDELLNFFDTVGMLVRRGVLDQEIAFHGFGRRILCYWEFARHRIEEVRRDYPTTWNDIDYLVKRLKAGAARRGKRSGPEDWQASFDDSMRARWKPLLLREAEEVAVPSTGGTPSADHGATASGTDASSSATCGADVHSGA